ncbi:DUF6099 family protein [Streptomyces sp. NPDC058953]|uniref:DUF6099 family protein n=1 Tax=unclassified Streptomyces TaxID=2593676 RepID=UPI0036960B63
MDAERLIDMSRHALARSRVLSEVVVEAWQAQLLAQTIGARLVALGPPELSRDARGLAETGGPGSGDLDRPGGFEPVKGEIRAARLMGIDDPREALIALGALLAEVGIALVGVACATDEEGLYWHCIEAMDAADEAGDRVRAMLRRLASGDLAGRDLRRPPGGVGERAGPSDAPVGHRDPVDPVGRVDPGSPVGGPGPALPPGPVPGARPRASGAVTSHVPLPPRSGRASGAAGRRPRSSGRPESPPDGAAEADGAHGLPGAVDSAAGAS